MSNFTKQAIAQSFRELLIKKPLNKITVADIAEHCGINRQTFYYHFQDVYDLVEWMCVELAEKALKNNRTYDTWQEGFLAIFLQVQSDKVFTEAIYHSVQFETLQRSIYRMVFPLLENVVKEKAAAYVVRSEDVDFIARFYMYAFVGLMLDWIRDGMNAPPNELVERTSTLIHGTGMEAVYTLLNVDRGVPEVWGSAYDVRELLKAVYYGLDKQPITSIKLSLAEKVALKTVVEKTQGTDIALLLKDSGLID